MFPCGCMWLCLGNQVCDHVRVCVWWCDDSVWLHMTVQHVCGHYVFVCHRDICTIVYVCVAICVCVTALRWCMILRVLV